MAGKKGMGWSPELMPEPLLGLVLSCCSGVGSVPLLVGTGKR